MNDLATKGINSNEPSHFINSLVIRWGGGRWVPAKTNLDPSRETELLLSAVLEDELNRTRQIYIYVVILEG